MEGGVVHGHAPALEEVVDYWCSVDGAVHGLSDQTAGLACLSPGLSVRIVVHFRDLVLAKGKYGETNGNNRFKIEVRQSSLPGLPEVIEVAQTVMQSLQAVGIDAHIKETEFGKALEEFRDRHDAHYLLPVRQTIRPLAANMRIYYYTGPIDAEKGRPTRGVLYMESPIADRVYEQMLSETDMDIRHKISQELGDYIYDEYQTIPVVNIKATIVGNPDVVEDYSFGGVTGVFFNMENIKAAR